MYNMQIVHRETISGLRCETLALSHSLSLSHTHTLHCYEMCCAVRCDAMLCCYVYININMYKNGGR